MQNMSDSMAKSCRLSHTIIICNIKSLQCTKLEKIEFAQKLPKNINCYLLMSSIMQNQVTTMCQSGENGVCPKAARACPNPRRLDILRTNFFLDLKFSGMVPLIIFYNCWSFKQNLMIFSWDIGQKPHFGPNLGPNLGQDIFFSKIGLRHFKSFIVG